jgi:hypothetical protein
MPAHFTRYPNSNLQIFEANSRGALRASHELLIDSELLGTGGTLRVPGHIWRAMQRRGAWIEPVLVTEWSRMMRNYAQRMGLVVGAGEAESALVWIEMPDASERIDPPPPADDRRGVIPALIGDKGSG